MLLLALATNALVLPHSPLASGTALMSARTRDATMAMGRGAFLGNMAAVATLAAAGVLPASAADKKKKAPKVDYKGYPGIYDAKALKAKNDKMFSDFQTKEQEATAAKAKANKEKRDAAAQAQKDLQAKAKAASDAKAADAADNKAKKEQAAKDAAEAAQAKVKGAGAAKDAEKAEARAKKQADLVETVNKRNEAARAYKTGGKASSPPPPAAEPEAAPADDAAVPAS